MLSHKFDEALTWAADLHRTQTRKTSNTPYIGHLLSVAGLVLESGGSENQAIAALLHDCVEDRGVTLAEIASRFSPEIAALVDAVTESDTQPKPEWLDRKKLYLEKLRHCPSEAVLISLADKLHNARGLEEGLHDHDEEMWHKFFKSRQRETAWFYGELINLYRERGLGNNWLFRELERLIPRIFPA